VDSVFGGVELSDVFRPDDESGTDPAEAGWFTLATVPGGEVPDVEYADDGDRGKVLHVTTTETEPFTGLTIIGDVEGLACRANTDRRTGKNGLADWLGQA
jgi:hypothetical protein